jgi:hypothetical protein
MNYTTVFDLSKGHFFDQAYIPFWIGVCFWVIGFLTLLDLRRYQRAKLLEIVRDHLFRDRTLFLLPMGVLLLVISLGIAISTAVKIGSVVQELADGRAETAEGVVSVEYVQPEGGHTKGDIIRVAGVAFEIDNFAGGLGYHLSIAHGGALTEGSRVRIYYDEKAGSYLLSNRRILRLDKVVDGTGN